MTYQPEDHPTHQGADTAAAAAAAAAAASELRPPTNNAAHAHHDSRFDCNICLEPVAEPVVSRCGHLYCWPCLYRWLQPGMTEDERYDMGWGSSDGGGGSGGYGIGNGDSRAASARRCCPVCKAECTVREVVPIYVRESDDHGDGAAAAASTNDEMDGIDESASLSHPSSPSDERAAAAETTDPTTSTGLRRRRGGAGGGGEFSALGGGNTEDFARNGDDNISISTISTEDDQAHVASAASASNGANAVSSRPNRTGAADVPSRPTAQPYLHQRSAAEDSTGMRPSEAPMTPLINNRQQRASTTGGIGRAPLSPPRGARPSSLSNGLSLSFWGGFVDALLGAQTNAAAATGNGNGAGGGYVPPIHRPGNGRGPHRATSAVSGGSAGDAGQHGTEDRGPSAGVGANGLPPTETTGGGRWFSPAFVEDSTTEFLSRLLLMLGCFVVFCLLLF